MFSVVTAVNHGMCSSYTSSVSYVDVSFFFLLRNLYEEPILLVQIGVVIAWERLCFPIAWPFNGYATGDHCVSL
jgi:hypothetical protein